jgi:origin recognition complex subunit 6
MSRATAEQALTGLVPALNGPLPQELIDLTLSLLARSRSVASSLKSDEEIARPYACAQLACERYFKLRFSIA